MRSAGNDLNSIDWVTMSNGGSNLECYVACQQQPGCTHFENGNGSTCYLKGIDFDALKLAFWEWHQGRRSVLMFHRFCTKIIFNFSRNIQFRNNYVLRIRISRDTVWDPCPIVYTLFYKLRFLTLVSPNFFIKKVWFNVVRRIFRVSLLVLIAI